MAVNRIDVGKRGEIVAANVRRLRGDMPFAELSERLTKLDRPIAALSLRYIEQCKRRVDVGDLEALADALDVPVVELLAENAEDHAALIVGKRRRLGGYVHPGADQ